MKNLFFLFIIAASSSIFLQGCTKQSTMIDSVISSKPTVKVEKFNTTPYNDPNEGDRYDAREIMKASKKLHTTYQYKYTTVSSGQFSSKKYLKKYSEDGVTTENDGEGGSIVTIYSDNPLPDTDFVDIQ